MKIKKFEEARKKYWDALVKVRFKVWNKDQSEIDIEKAILLGKEYILLLEKEADENQDNRTK